MNSPKQRHGCLTAWLILIIIANGLTALITPLAIGSIRQAIPGFPTWMVWPIALLSILNVIFAIALFNWMKWGFYGFVVNSLIAFGLNLYAGIGILQSVLGLVGIPVLYGVLHIGGKTSGWAQLETGRGTDNWPGSEQRYSTQCSICGAPLSGRDRYAGLCRRCQERAA